MLTSSLMYSTHALIFLVIAQVSDAHKWTNGENTCPNLYAPNFAMIAQVSDADKWPMDRPHAPCFRNGSFSDTLGIRW